MNKVFLACADHCCNPLAAICELTFTIGYGEEAQEEVLEDLARKTQAKYYRGDPGNIREIQTDSTSFYGFESGEPSQAYLLDTPRAGGNRRQRLGSRCRPVHVPSKLDEECVNSLETLCTGDGIETPPERKNDDTEGRIGQSQIVASRERTR
jgi:hypothetical protein